MTKKRTYNPLAAKRHKARHYALQALYQWYMADASLNEIEAEFRADYDFSKVDGEYFHALLHEVPAQLEDLEAIFAQFMVERSLEELDPIERALLRLGTFELKERIDVPFKVVINEAVNLAKKFGATDSHKFINGVLDQAARQLRQPEVAEVEAAG
ncbi:MAG: transcription antitermination factor NusB [Gammaproteobacteria bacterium]|nr:transcription antitermination factor NusB [Gammaproteobacteria bacterium]